MNDTTLNEILIKNLELHLQKYLPHHPIGRAYEYSIFPPGKLFRPNLAHNLFLDFLNASPNASSNSQSILQLHLKNPNSPLSLLCSFLELHHVYTLIHDDLPCMDDDEFRRGKPSLHIKYGEGPALLVGDGLLNLSYTLLGEILRTQLNSYPNEISPNPELMKYLITLLGRFLGPKGIIHGQILDIENAQVENHEKNHNTHNTHKTQNTQDTQNTQNTQNTLMTFEQLMTIHRLKTSRLFQCALLGSFLIFPQAYPLPWKPLHLGKSLYRLGDELGMMFQLIDDYDDFQNNPNDPNNSVRLFPSETSKKMAEIHRNISLIFTTFQLHELKSYFAIHLKKIEGFISKIP